MQILTFLVLGHFTISKSCLLQIRKQRTQKENCEETLIESALYIFSDQTDSNNDKITYFICLYAHMPFSMATNGDYFILS